MDSRRHAPCRESDALKAGRAEHWGSARPPSPAHVWRHRRTGGRALYPVTVLEINGLSARVRADVRVPRHGYCPVGRFGMCGPVWHEAGTEFWTSVNRLVPAA